MNGTLNDEDRAPLATRRSSLLRDQLLELAQPEPRRAATSSAARARSARALGGDRRHGGRRASSTAATTSRSSVLVGDGVDVAVTLRGERALRAARPERARASRADRRRRGHDAPNEGTGLRRPHAAARRDRRGDARRRRRARRRRGETTRCSATHTLVVDAPPGTVQPRQRGRSRRAAAARAMPSARTSCVDERARRGAAPRLHRLHRRGLHGHGQRRGLDLARRHELHGARLQRRRPRAHRRGDRRDVLHVDATARRAARATELVTFGGAVNVFDVLQGIVDDLDNVHGLANRPCLAAPGDVARELDRNQHERAAGDRGARLQGSAAGGHGSGAAALRASSPTACSRASRTPTSARSCST